MHNLEKIKVVSLVVIVICLVIIVWRLDEIANYLSHIYQRG
ncbi:hypothetical protein [Paenisporosarcina sp. TG20]|nr:hypothetical protein [Paenisporosarcina sp. TG20]